jgi:hypothetical protein
MNGTSGFGEVQSSTPDHHHIGYCTSNGIDSEQVPGSFSMRMVSSISPQESAERGKVFLGAQGSRATPISWSN